MNRADRRRLKRMAKHPDRLAHAIASNVQRGAASTAETVKLVGGPMDGWLVMPDAPALRLEWYAGYVEATAAGLVAPGEWSRLSEDEREPHRDRVRLSWPPGRYVLDGRQARWALTG